MLNRKTSNYIFYGILIAILVLGFGVRAGVLAGLNSRIESVQSSNRLTQARIDSLKDTVQQNRDLKVDHLYSLYDQVPNHFNQTELTYYTIAQLELIGITEDSDILRTVYVDETITFPANTPLSDIQAEFKVVEVEVYFNTMDISVVDEFIDLLHESDQIFVLNLVDYNTPEGEEYVGVTINFLAFYNIEEES